MKQVPIIFSLFTHENLVKLIHKECHFELGKITQHQFPDDETVIKIESNVTGRHVILLASLEQPNPKLLPLIYAAETARSLGALKITLIAPYLAYMRQDKIFEPGQGITSKYFAQLISHYFDGLITFDPHLHRWHTLSAIYTIPTAVLHAADNIAQWIHNHIQRPILIGPDAESRQWVEDIARKANAPFLILEKIRKGDNSVDVSIPDIKHYQDFIPVLIDDIISTGTTLLEAVKQIQKIKLPPPICIGVHAVFAGESYQKLLASRVGNIITCNTIQHPSNGIDISTNIIHFLKNAPEFIRLG